MTASVVDLPVYFTMHRIILRGLQPFLNMCSPDCCKAQPVAHSLDPSLSAVVQSQSLFTHIIWQLHIHTCQPVFKRDGFHAAMCEGRYLARTISCKSLSLLLILLLLLLFIIMCEACMTHATWVHAARLL